MKERENGIFIVFEGGEGSGKTTQVRLLSEWLIQQGCEVRMTKQPGGDEGICKGIRELLLDPRYFNQFSPRTELLLFMADKAQHVDYVIRPALAEGKIVISDRYNASTYAYQVAARKSCSTEEFDVVSRYTLQGLEPDLTIWLDVDPEVGLSRNSRVPSQQLRFEKESLDFHTRVRSGFEEYFTKHRDTLPVLRIDASQSVEENHSSIIEKITSLLP